jgi:hypothetical protein
MRHAAGGERAIPDPWVPHRDGIAYLVAVLIIVLELPILAVLALATFVARGLAAIARRSREAARSATCA